MTENGLVPSLDLVKRTLLADVSYTISRMQVLERLPGNPIGIAYRRLDDSAVALMSRFLPAFSRVVGLSPAHVGHIEPLARWYRDHGVKPTFEMVPGMYHPDLGRELTRLGYFQSGFHVSLIGDPSVAVAVSDEPVVERVLGPSEMEQFLDAYVAGWGIAREDHAQFKSNVRPWPEQPGWSLYLARVNGQPAGAATLYMHDRVGYLPDAATDPAFRGHRLHSVLLRRRIHDAGVAGADCVFSGAAPFSTSHRNLERVGMRVQFVRSLWTPIQ